jgi:DNA repair exonuclease SbcCD nuclease subunit
MSDEVTYIMTGDVHMSNRLPYAKPSEDGRTDRFEDQLDLLRLMKVKAIQYDAAGIVINGDFFDKASLDPVTLADTMKVVAEIAAEVRMFFLPGNHDAASIRGGRFNVEALAVIPGVTLLTKGCVFGVEPWLRIHPLPFAPADENMASVKEMRKGLDKSYQNILLFHNGVVGCKHLAWVCDDGVQADQLCKKWTAVISGHFHSRQKFGSCGRYLGAPMQHHFGDAGERRGFYAVSFKVGKAPKFKFIPSKLPEFHKVEGYELDNIPTVATGDYVMLVVECTTADWKMIESEAAKTAEALGKMGINAHYKHKPIYHHTDRAGDSGVEDLSMPSLVSEYVTSSDVVLGELDDELLRSIGQEILKEAQASA